MSDAEDELPIPDLWSEADLDLLLRLSLSLAWSHFLARDLKE